MKIFIYNNLNMFNFFSLIIILLYNFLIMLDDLIDKWIIFELSTILFISMISLKYKDSIVNIYYYSISSIISLFLMMMVIYLMSSSLVTGEYANIFLQMLMLMKIGLFPWMFLMIKIYSKLMWLEIFYLSTFMKFIPIYFFTSITNENLFIYLILLLNLFFIIFYSMKLNNLKKIIACSSINNCPLMILMSYYDSKFFYFYSLIYMMFFYLLIYFFNNFNINDFYDLGKNMIMIEFKVIYSLIVFMYSMLPPFCSVLLKWMMMNYMVLLMGDVYMWLLINILSFIVMVWNYFKLLNFIFNNYKMKKVLYYKNINYFLFYMIFSMGLFLILIFNYF